MSNFYDINNIKNYNIYEKIFNILSSDIISFNLELSEKIDYNINDSAIKKLVDSNFELLNKCIKNSIYNDDKYKLTSCYRLADVFQTNIFKESIIFNRNKLNYLLRIYVYFGKLVSKDCDSILSFTSFNDNNFNKLKEELLNLHNFSNNKNIKWEFIDSDYVYGNPDTNIKSDSEITILGSNITIHPFNIYDTNNLYNLHSLIKKKYSCFNGCEYNIYESNEYIDESISFQQNLIKILIAYQVLEKNGNMLLIFEGCISDANKQLIYFLSSIFTSIELINTIISLNYKVGFYVLCKGFLNFDNKIFDELVKCNKKINSVNQTFGQNLFIKDSNIIEKYNLIKKNSLFNKSDYNHVKQFIKYKPNDAIETSINNVIIKSYTIANEFLSYIKDMSFLSYDESKLIKSKQETIASHLITKLFNIKENIIPQQKSIDKLHVRYISIIHIPRSGGTGLKMKLYEHRDKEDSVSQRNFVIKSKEYNYSIMSASHMVAEEYPLHSFKISVIRNPYEKFVSAFDYIKEGGKNNPVFPDAEKYLQGFFIKNKINNPIDIFKADMWVKDKILENLFFKPQYTFICDKSHNIIVDKLYKLEEIHQLYQYLNNLLNIKIDYKTKINQTGQTSSLTPEEKQHIYNYYKLDFVIFGYEPLSLVLNI